MQLIEIEFVRVDPELHNCDIVLTGHHNQQPVRIPMHTLPPRLRTAVIDSAITGQCMRAMVNSETHDLRFVDWDSV